MTEFNYNIDAQRARPWVDRSERAVAMLAPVFAAATAAGRRLSMADVGCGDEKLRAFVTAKGLDVDYRGFDINPQSPRVVRFDATTEELPGEFDLVASMGLIEYIPVREYFSMVRRHARRLIVSHVARDLNPRPPEHLARMGWVNQLESVEVEELLRQVDWTVEQTAVTADEKTRIWLCS